MTSNKAMHLIPVDTRRRFNVDTTSCVYCLLLLLNFEQMFEKILVLVTMSSLLNLERLFPNGSQQFANIFFLYSMSFANMNRFVDNYVFFKISNRILKRKIQFLFIAIVWRLVKKLIIISSSSSVYLVDTGRKLNVHKSSSIMGGSNTVCKKYFPPF